MAHHRAAEVQASSRGLTVVASNPGRMADGLDLRASRVDLMRFRANPVVLFGHDHKRPPIGRAKVRQDGERLLAGLEFDVDDAFAAEIDRKMRAGFIRAVSVGLNITGPIDRDGVAESWELTELSVVSVPLDAGALTTGERDRVLQLARSMFGPAEPIDLDPVGRLASALVRGRQSGGLTAADVTRALDRAFGRVA